ncbi:MAG: hypothetical protein IKA65_04430 [Lentisphaeria bacterium]|nr:hypothetical protein [Lentisphaeria bacterium]
MSEACLPTAAAALCRNAALKEAAAQWGFGGKSHLARLLKKHNIKVCNTLHRG